MNDIQLRFVIKAAETRSFGKTAKYFHTSYQTVSYNIQTFESELSIKIFSRTNKGCTLTAEGDIIYKFAKNFIDSYDVLKRNIILTKAIRVGIDIRYIPPELFEFINSISKIDINLIPIDFDSLANQLDAKVIDCYLGYETHVHDNSSFISLVTDSIGIALSSKSPLSERTRIEYADLSDKKIYIGKFGWMNKNDVLFNISERLTACNLIDDYIESLAIADIYSNNAVAFIPCGFSFIFNDKAKVIPFEKEIVRYGVFYTSENKKIQELINNINIFLSTCRQSSI